MAMAWSAMPWPINMIDLTQCYYECELTFHSRVVFDHCTVHTLRTSRRQLIVINLKQFLFAKRVMLKIGGTLPVTVFLFNLEDVIHYRIKLCMKACRPHLTKHSFIQAYKKLLHLSQVAFGWDTHEFTVFDNNLSLHVKR